MNRIKIVAVILSFVFIFAAAFSFSAAANGGQINACVTTGGKGRGDGQDMIVLGQVDEEGNTVVNVEDDDDDKKKSKGGKIRIVQSTDECKRNEMPLVWNISGAAGLQGPQGEAGADGAAGPAGPPGAAGTDGAAGPQGAVGPSGPQGEPGAAGANGEMGPAGQQGSAGVDGAPGIQGPAGPQGPSGVPDVYTNMITASGSALKFRNISQEVSCNPGDTAVGGGYYLHPEQPGSGSAYVGIFEFVISYPKTSNSWEVHWLNTAINGYWPYIVDVYVNCV